MDHNEYESLVNELAKGKKLAEERARRLENIGDRVVERILASYKEALNLLTRPEPQGQCQSVISSASNTSTPSVSVCNDNPPKDSSIGPLKRKPVDEDSQNMTTKMHQERLQKVSASSILASKEVLAELSQAESDPQEKCQSVESSLPDPSSTSSSVLNATLPKDSRSDYKRRSRQDVRSVTIHKSQETTLEDGYAWRKYGEKEILGAKYPRSYFRCTHRFDNGCVATKQVQRSDNDPTKFDVTYRGVHTCYYADALPSKPKSEEYHTDALPSKPKSEEYHADALPSTPKSEDKPRVISQGSNSVGSSTL